MSVLKTIPLFLVFLTPIKSMAQIESKPLLKIEIPAESQSKTIKMALDTGLKLFNSENIPQESIDKLNAPFTVQIPRILLGKIRKAFEKTQITSQLESTKISQLYFGSPDLKCNQDNCHVVIPLIQFSAKFNLKIKDENNKILFAGRQLGLDFGNPEYHDAHKFIIESAQELSFDKISQNSPLLSFDFKIKKNGTLPESIEITSTPKIKIPDKSIKFHMNLSSSEMNQIDEAGKLGIFDFLKQKKIVVEPSKEEKLDFINQQPTSIYLDDKIMTAYYLAAGNELVKLGRFDEADSLHIFMLIKLFSQEVLFHESSVLDLLQDTINTKIMPIALHYANEAIQTLKVLTEVDINSPEFDLQNEFDYPKNKEIATNITIKFQKGLEISEKEWNSFYNRFNKNTDFRSIILLQKIEKDLFYSRHKLYLQQIQNIKNSISKIRENIKSLKRKVNLKYKLEKSPQTESETNNSHLTLDVNSSLWGDAEFSQLDTSRINFSKKCDVITHISVASLNLWLQSEYDNKLLRGCYKTAVNDICSLDQKHILGELIEVASNPKLEWDSSKQAYTLKLPRVNKSTSLSYLDFTNKLGITRDTIKVEIGFIPEPCENGTGNLCLRPTGSSGYLTIDNTNALTKIVSFAKIIQWPYFVFGNALVLMSTSIAQNSMMSTSVNLPKIKIVEIKNSEKFISVCSEMDE